MMPPAKIFLLLIFSWAVFPRPLQAREEPPASPSWPRCVPARPGSRILFLGNSYTFFNRMPAMVKAMADTKGLRPDVHMHAAPAASLQSHWNDRRARSNMEGTAWDFVILQDQSATYPGSGTNHGVRRKMVLSDTSRQRNAHPDADVGEKRSFRNSGPAGAKGSS